METMLTEKPKPIGWRMYKRHKKIAAALKRKLGCLSEAQVVRKIIDDAAEKYKIRV